MNQRLPCLLLLALWPVFVSATSKHTPQPFPTVADDSHIGVIRPMRWARMSAEIDGRIAERLVEEHDAVVAGTVVIALDPTLRRAELDAALAAKAEADARLVWTNADLERARRLLEEDTAAKADFDRAEAAQKMAAASVLAASAQVAQMRHRLEQTTIRAPFDGVISQIDVEAAEYVVPGRFLFSIMEIQRVKIESFVDATIARTISVDDKVEVSVDGGTVVAKVRSVAPGTDNESRTFKVVLHAENDRIEPGGQWRLRPGCTIFWRTKKDAGR